MDRPTSPLPALHVLLSAPEAAGLIARFGQAAATEALRATLDTARAERRFGLDTSEVLHAAGATLAARSRASARPVFNLTGTVSHTNLGRALLPDAAAAAAAEALRSATNLEYDLAHGRRGERDDHIAPLLCELTGAEAATVVNNNAAAVMLVLNTLAAGKQVVLSRGEMIEIGGAFRIPDIIRGSGAILREVGTTNRTHPRDYLGAIGPDTALLLRVHPSNYAITGFTAVVPTPDLAVIAHDADLPLVEDLGSGSLVDLEQWGLPHEQLPQESLAAGVDLVTFSGDKLLGGPQCGLIAGRADLIRRLNANPMKRALRLDKGRIAALEAVLRLALDPGQVAVRLPALRLLTRTEAEIKATANRIATGLRVAFPDRPVGVMLCHSQIGSGALPQEILPSAAVTIGGPGPQAVAAALRSLARPVIGRIKDDLVWLDCRCLEPQEEAEFLRQLPRPD